MSCENTNTCEEKYSLTRLDFFLSNLPKNKTWVFYTGFQYIVNINENNKNIIHEMGKYGHSLQKRRFEIDEVNC